MSYLGRAIFEQVSVIKDTKFLYMTDYASIVPDPCE